MFELTLADCVELGPLVRDDIPNDGRGDHEAGDIAAGEYMRYSAKLSTPGPCAVVFQ